MSPVCHCIGNKRKYRYCLMEQTEQLIIFSPVCICTVYILIGKKYIKKLWHIHWNSFVLECFIPACCAQSNIELSSFPNIESQSLTFVLPETPIMALLVLVPVKRAVAVEAESGTWWLTLYVCKNNHNQNERTIKIQRKSILKFFRDSHGMQWDILIQI